MPQNSLVTHLKKGAKVIRQFKNPLFEVSLKDTNILTVELSPSQFDKEEVQQVLENVKYLAQNRKYLVLVNSGPVASITYEGLKVLAKHESFSYAFAKAYVIQTISQRIMANLYLRYFKPKIPIRFFKSKKDAELWLLKSFRHLYYPQQTFALT